MNAIRRGLFGMLVVFLTLAPPLPAQGLRADLARVDGELCSGSHVLAKLRGDAPVARAAKSSGVLPTAADVAALLGLPAGMRAEPSGFTRWQRRGTAAARPATPDAEAIDPGTHFLVQLGGRMDVAETLRRLRANPAIEWAEPDGVGSGGSTIPTDPSYPDQWHLPKIQAPTAWDTTRGATNVIVAVLDTGVNSSLSEFAGRLLPGVSFVSDNASTEDDHGHGTSVMGTLGANANNGVVGAGVDWNCRLLPVKVLDSDNNGLYSWWADGVQFAVAQGAKVINLSAGGSTESSALTAAIRDAIARGVIFVCITHNDGTNVIRFPGRLPESITIGATERNDTRASFSNYGARVDLVAPGRDIYTVSRTGQTTFWFGTSFAAPQVSGVAALLASFRPNLTQESVRSLLRSGADDQVGDATDTPGFDQYYGYGRLNAARTVLLARAQLGSPPPPNKLVNVSTRARIGTGDDVLIGGLVIGGDAPKRVLIRALGPSLAAAGVQGVLLDPAVQVFNAAGTLLRASDNWSQESSAAEITATGLAPTNAAEAAVVLTLPPGAYTAVVRGATGGTGVGLVEAYELTASEVPRFLNLSSRGRVGTGDDVMIAGLVVTGSQPRRVLVRALGPSLSSAGVQGVLADPSLQIFQGGRAFIASSNWLVGPERDAVQATGRAPTSSLEAAVVVTLAPGAYTAIIRGQNDGTGVALVEAYDLD